MREIKFRAWDLEEKELITGDDNQGSCLGDEGGYFDLRVFPERYEIMQFTGLKDKNKKEIYSGDIVKHVREISWNDDYHTGEPSEQNRTITRIGVISITPNGVRLNGTKLEEFEDGERKNIFCKWSGNLTCWSEMSEVIGNIKENPELLEVII